MEKENGEEDEKEDNYDFVDSKDDINYNENENENENNDIINVDNIVDDEQD